MKWSIRLGISVLCVSLITCQASAGIDQTLGVLKERVSSTTGALITLSMAFCGLAYWNMRLQERQTLLKKDLVKEKQRIKDLQYKMRILIKDRSKQDKSLLEIRGSLTELQQNFNKRLCPIELAIYGKDSNDDQKADRLKRLHTYIGNRIVATGTMGEAEVSESLTRTPESPDSDSEQDPLSARSTESVFVFGSASQERGLVKNSSKVALIVGEAERSNQDRAESPSNCLLM